MGHSFRDLVGAQPDDFLVSYAGSMGYSQDLDTLLDAAHLLRDMKGVRFVLVGEGVERDRLVRRAQHMRLPNVQFLPMQPRHAYRGILCGSDACVVTLRKEIDTPAVPAKLGQIMAAGRPVIAVVPDVSDVVRVVEASGAGMITPPGSPERFCQAIRELRADRRLGELCGVRGRAYALRELDIRMAASRYEEIMRNVFGERRARRTS
jgi:glycosyltransferase involved in cell wall biosynthesis